MSTLDRSFPSSIEPSAHGWASSAREGGPGDPPRRGINPFLWGPSTWTCIHYVALGYPENPTPADADDYRAFFASLPFVLPCQTCRLNLASHLNSLPPDQALANGRRALFDWTVDLHNLSISNHRRPCVDHDQAWNLYTRDRFVQMTRTRRLVELASAATIGVALYVFAVWSVRRYRASAL